MALNIAAGEFAGNMLTALLCVLMSDFESICLNIKMANVELSTFNAF